LWKAATALWGSVIGRELRRFKGHGSEVTSVAFAPDGRSLATGSADNTARLWDAATGRELRRFEGHAHYIDSVAFAPDGHSLATGSYDNTARLRANRRHLEWIDLRLGAGTAQAETEAEREAQVLKVCLDEVRRSRPFLIALVGDRYGWVPPHDRAETLLADGHAAEARQHAAQAVDLVRSCAERFPGSPQWQADRKAIADLLRRVNATSGDRP
jgi:dipeptidyl aminopeptidase/acylaminoacyl peptidase